jgi:hypothetical protein
VTIKDTEEMSFGGVVHLNGGVFDESANLNQRKGMGERQTNEIMMMESILEDSQQIDLLGTVYGLEDCKPPHQRIDFQMFLFHLK